LSTLAEVGVEGRVGDGSQYRVSERFLYSDRTTERDGLPDEDTQTTLNNPSVDLRTTIGNLTWEQGYEIQDDRQRTTGPGDNDTLRTDLLQKLVWAPEPGLPQVTTWLDYRTLEDDTFFEQETVEAVLEVTQEIGAFSYEQSIQNEKLTDDAAQSETERTEYLFRGTYAEEHLGGDLATSLSVFVDERSTSVRFPSGAGGLVPLIPVPLSGASVIDTTPQIAVLASNTAVSDGDTLASAGINIGGFAGGGLLNWNIGLELNPGDSVDQIRLYTTTTIDPLFENDFSFSVWTSDDNNFWTLVTSSAAYDYEGPNRRFLIAVPPVSGRYIKIVNTSSPSAAPAVLVSELEVWSRTTGTSTTRTKSELEDSIRSVTGSASWRASQVLTLVWDVFAQTFESDQEGTSVRDETRIENGLAALWAPHEKVDVSLRAEDRRRNEDVLNQRDEDVVTLSALTTVRVLETLDVSFNYSHTDRDFDGEDDLETDAAQVSASAQVLETLQFDVSAEVSSQMDETNLREIDRTTLSASIFSELTPELEVTLGLRNENGDVTGPGAGGLPDPSEERYELVMVYRPQDRLTTQVQLERVDTFAGSGLDQRYQLDWIPFRDGSLNVQLDFDREDSESFGSEKVDRYRGLVRWTMNPSAFLEMTWGTEVPDTGERTDLLTLSLSVTPY
jgi:hypothetical protein